MDQIKLLASVNSKLKGTFSAFIDNDNMVLINGWNSKGEFYWDYITLEDYNFDYKELVEQWSNLEKGN